MPKISYRVRGLAIGTSHACTVKAGNTAGQDPVPAPSSRVTPSDITPILNLLLHD